MTITFSVGEEPPVDLLAITETWLKEALEDLAAAIQVIKAGEMGRAKETLVAVRDLKAAMQLMMEERGRVEKLAKQVAGAFGASELDFHSARDEIGRRLARLRDAG